MKNLLKNSLVALLIGFVFAIGLGLSGMTQPQKVVGFLDLFGNWDPSLLFVMVGAITVHAVSYLFIVKKMPKPLLETKWDIPTKKDITPTLVIGSLLFGIGWGAGRILSGAGRNLAGKL